MRPNKLPLPDYPISTHNRLRSPPETDDLKHCYVFLLVAERLYKATSFRPEWWVGKSFHNMTRHVNDEFFQLFAPGQYFPSDPKPLVYATVDAIDEWRGYGLGPARFWYKANEERTPAFIQRKAGIPETQYPREIYDPLNEQLYFDAP